MSRGILQDFVNQLNRDTVFPFFTVQLHFDTAQLNFWSGLYDLQIGDTTYTGAGDLLEVSSIEETTELAAFGATLTMSGLDSSTVSLALQEPYQGRECNIGFGVFNGFSQPGSLQLEQGTTDFVLLESGDKILLEGNLYHVELFSGYMDMINVNEAPEGSTIQVQVENRMIDLERERSRRYNSATQKQKYPNDKGLNYAEDAANREVILG